MDDYAERVRRRAYQIWLEEGRPEGRESTHWDMASELVAIEDQQAKTTKPVRRSAGDTEVAAHRAEPPAPAAAMGELPTITDEGEQTYPPSRAAERETVVPKPAPASRPASAKGNGVKSSSSNPSSSMPSFAKPLPVKSTPGKTKPAKRGKT
jgi:hypothetical protein